MMRRSFAGHPRGGFLLVISGCRIGLVKVENAGHMHVGIALRVGNGGRNRPAEQGGQNQQQRNETNPHYSPTSMSAAVWQRKFVARLQSLLTP